MSSFLSQLMVVPTSSFLHFHVPMNGLFQSIDHVPNDFPAITISSFLQRYVPTTALQALSATTATTTVIKTPVSTTMTATTKAILIKLDNCPTNATSTATGLTSLNDVTIAHVSATTATTTATMTQVPATATLNAPKYQINKCKATQTQHKTRSPSILHPAKKGG
jgi:4-hydroxyphenylpyruvate dioxygenase-like putative hemolysin